MRRSTKKTKKDELKLLLFDWFAYLSTGGLDMPIASIPDQLLRSVDFSDQSEKLCGMLLGLAIECGVPDAIQVVCASLSKFRPLNDSTTCEEAIIDQYAESIDDAIVAICNLSMWRARMIECNSSHETLRRLLIDNESIKWNAK